jgi:hyperosmotically inducible protein
MKCFPSGAVATLLLLFGAAGCGNEPPKETATQTPGTTQTAGSTEPSRDARITTAVQAKFYTEELTRGRAIDVSAEDGVVTLRGTVTTEPAKQRAMELARGVDGVTRVADQLQVRESTTASARGDGPPTVAGTTGSDSNPVDRAWITTKIQAQYFADSELKPWAIDVTTESNGVVMLEGTVDSAEDKTTAVRIARETDGVTRVEDRLRVEATRGGLGAAIGPAPPDPWITAKIQAKYFVDDDVKARNIDVTTQNGVVTLQGAVTSDAERRQAIAIARNTDGVRDVTDQLRLDRALAGTDAVSPPADRTRARETAALDRPDPWVTMKIQAKYFLDADVKGRQIDVDTRNGVVTLKGTVENTQQKQEAEQIAGETEGVRRVVNQLAVATVGVR